MKPDAKVYVDCLAAPGGDGSKNAPLPSITAALPIAKALSATSNVTIDVAKGVYDDEHFPIKLDFPVHLKGSRSPEVDAAGWPVGVQEADTLVTASTTAPPTTFFEITGTDVQVSRLSVDGTMPAGADDPSIAPSGPTGVSAKGAVEFVVKQMRIVRLNQAIRSEGASGRITDNYFDEVGSGVFISGGDATAPPKVVFSDNRIVYRVNGIALAGAGTAGFAIRAVIAHNDVVTSYTNTGPTNPAALRISPMVGAAANVVGTVDVEVEGNQLRGSAKYGIILHAGQPTRRVDGGTYPGVLKAHFEDNVIGDNVVIPSLITFTNVRATVFPCELDPHIPKGPACPTLMGPPWTYWEYLKGSNFFLRHSGELDDARIDDPDLHPVDGYTLHNVLRINNEVFVHKTFLVVP